MINQEFLKPNESVKQFGDLHEEIQELLPEEEQETYSKVYDILPAKNSCFREAVQKWMVEAGQRISEKKNGEKVCQIQY